MMRLFKLFRLVLVYSYDFVGSNLLLAKQVLSPRMGVNPQQFELEIKVDRPFEILMLSNLITFTPGTLTLEIEPGKKVVVHALNYDPELPGKLRARLEKPLAEVFGK